MYTEVDTIFYNQQLSVITRQVRLMMEMADDIMMRLDEMQGELDRELVTNRFNDNWMRNKDASYASIFDEKCTCDECVGDKSYRMD